MYVFHWHRTVLMRVQYIKLIARGLANDNKSRGQGVAMSEWFKECNATKDVADRLDIAIRAASSVEAVLKSLERQISFYRQRMSEENEHACEASSTRLLLSELTDHSKAVQDQLLTLQTKAERTATIASLMTRMLIWYTNLMRTVFPSFRAPS